MADGYTILLSVITSGVISAGISGVITLTNGHWQRKAEAKLKTRELALTLALEEWKQHCKLADSGKTGGVRSPDIFVYRYHQILSKMEDGTLDESAMATIQRKTMILSEANDAEIKKFRQERGEPNLYDDHRPTS